MPSFSKTRVAVGRFKATSRTVCCTSIFMPTALPSLGLLRTTLGRIRFEANDCCHDRELSPSSLVPRLQWRQRMRLGDRTRDVLEKVPIFAGLAPAEMDFLARHVVSR